MYMHVTYVIKFIHELRSYILSISSIALTSLYSTVVQTNLISELYPASLVGYSYNIFRTAHGVRLTISGYSDETVIKTFIKIISNGML